MYIEAMSISSSMLLEVHKKMKLVLTYLKNVVFWKVECTLKLIDKLDANAALESKLLFGLFTESLQCDLLYTECVSLKCTGRFMLVLFLQLILVSVLNCLYDSVSHMLRKNVEKRALIDNMDGIFLAIDEICDNG